MKSINDLPIYDLWPIIFSNLSIQDLFNCRLVNNQFKYFSDHTNSINKLVIGQPNSLFDVNYWYYDNKLIEDQDIISLECFRTIKSLSIFNLDKNLKYLKIYDQKLKLRELSNLINLESLEFGRRDGNYYQQTINLNNLKVFASSDLLVKLNTPKLEKIQFYDITEIKLDCNPESIKHLITRDYDNKLEIFNNLEIIELRDAEQSMINENLLIIFKNLKQLKINLDFYKVKYSDERIENSLINILNDKMKLGREIDVYLEGVKIENIDKFNELKANENPYWKFRLNNYDLLDLNLSFIQDLNYGQLEKRVNNIENDLQSNFFEKFQFINRVGVLSGVNNFNSLNWFLNNLKCLTSLSIAYPLGQLFYDNLPNTIKYLTIEYKEDLNYDFISKLCKLIEFSTYVDKDLFELAFTSFLNLKQLKIFTFHFKGNEIEIKKNGKYFNLNVSNFRFESYFTKEELDYNQLVVECNKLRSK